MELNLKGKTALVTGGSRGIGRAIAARLAGAGAAVVICGRTAADLEAAARELAAGGGQVSGVVADVANEEDVARLFTRMDETYGGLDILVNNAGVGFFRPLAEVSTAEWRAVIETNLSGVFFCSRAAVPRMAGRGGGSIINISSLAAINAFAGGAVYNTSKFGLNGMTEALMLDYRYQGIRVSTVMPGSVSTEFRGGGQADWKIAPEDIAEAVAMILAMPARTLVSRVEIRPTQPQKH
jgi:NAD(P)-dependent dehydrogenase (short-subunit alcohol dehydrogenase family)